MYMDTYEENGIMPDPNQQEAPMPEQDDPTPAEEVVAESSDMDQPRQEATADNMPMINTTTNSSIKVKPFFISHSFCYFSSFRKL